MDQYGILLIISLLCLVPAGSKASNNVSTAEEYWKSVLPNTPMPKTIQDLLPTSESLGGVDARQKHGKGYNTESLGEVDAREKYNARKGYNTESLGDVDAREKYNARKGSKESMEDVDAREKYNARKGYKESLVDVDAREKYNARKGYNTESLGDVDAREKYNARKGYKESLGDVDAREKYNARKGYKESLGDVDAREKYNARKGYNTESLGGVDAREKYNARKGYSTESLEGVDAREKYNARKGYNTESLGDVDAREKYNARKGYYNTEIPGTVRQKYSARRKYSMESLDDVDARRKYGKQYNNKANKATTSPLSDTTIFYLYNDLHPGKTMKLLFTNSGSKAGFLSRQVAESIPFSSDRLPDTLNYLGISPMSREARLVRETIEGCEDPNMEGEDKFCATSLESLIDLNVERLGKNVQVISTETGKKQEYTVSSEAKRIGGTLTVCHKERYPYAVYYCHEIKDTDVYVVPLVAADGTKIKAITVCHMDTSAWSPKHIAFEVLKVKPGPPVCHFLASDTLVWVKN